MKIDFEKIFKDLEKTAKEFEKNTIRKLWNEIKGLITPETKQITETEQVGGKIGFTTFLPLIIILIVLIFLLPFLFKKFK